MLEYLRPGRNKKSREHVLDDNEFVPRLDRATTIIDQFSPGGGLWARLCPLGMGCRADKAITCSPLVLVNAIRQRITAETKNIWMASVLNLSSDDEYIHGLAVAFASQVWEVE